MKFLKWVFFCVGLFLFAGCTSATNGETGGEDGPETIHGGASGKSSSSESAVSSASALSVKWVETSAGFAISQTEVTQADYYSLMGTLPVQLSTCEGDSFPVANVSWYEAILFANALSKRMGLDTAYSYAGILSGGKLSGLQIDQSKRAVRLPTAEEWILAYRAGTRDSYYWGTDVASKYAQYILTNGYMPVAQKLPNSWNLYDMAGNVSEWTLDTALRGGSWRSKAAELAFDQYEKKSPDFASEESGFRVILSGE